ncbi:MAG TPA: CHAT domain-containing protein [Bryobacteraceae bacterium]|nr:CHAT domain-containing protein [Bryobacteraceae bacterium]
MLLSFCLGKHKSFVWAVTNDDVSLYELPDESTIANQAKAFSSAAQNGQDTTAPGRMLSQTLFGQLSPAVWRKRNWLLAADGVLLGGVPFSALPDISQPSQGTFLIERHSLRLLPSELLLCRNRKNAVQPAGRFLGIADPIYNMADARARPLHLMKAASSELPARLVGSGTEVATAAKVNGLPASELLLGDQASGDGLRRALFNAPEVIHFAVHIKSPEGRAQEAALALSLTQNGLPELLTPEVVATYRVPGSLVVLSGCSSQQGQVLPSAGLVGLSRAWLLAGASAVVVSAWPTLDDTSDFFAMFYTHLRSIRAGSLAQRASMALQQAQMDAERGSGRMRRASVWAAYSVISGN